MVAVLRQAKASPVSTPPILATGLQCDTAMPLLQHPWTDSSLSSPFLCRRGWQQQLPVRAAVRAGRPERGWGLPS